jgi:starch-binding outer membrane protein, SusD/RagB family
MKKINIIKNISLVTGLAMMAALAPSCNKEYINPSAGSNVSVTQSIDGLMNLAAGLQRRFTVGRQSPMYTAPIGGAYSVFALRTLNVGNIDEANLEIGRGAIANNNSVVRALWTECLLTKVEAELILNNLSIVPEIGDRVGLKAYGSIFYALSMGTLTQFFEKVPITTANNATFNSREEVLRQVVTVLESVDTDLATTAPSAKFNSRIPAGVDIRNTVKALLARYYNQLSMITGTYNATDGNKAITNATAVNATVKSEFRYSGLTPNPLGNANFTNNIVGPIDSTLGLKGALAPVSPITDPRIGFYIARNGTIFNFKAFALGDLSPYPVYLIGEMYLIRAENLARQNTVPAAVTALNLVLQKSTDPFGVNANGAAYSGAVTQTAVLDEIYKQRRIELFLCGQELEDSRRFNRVAPILPPAPINANAERNRTFYPYPITERSNNTNTPADPAI